MEKHIEKRFEEWFGVSSGRNLGEIGNLCTGSQLKKFSEELTAQKDKAMKEAMAKLKIKREKMVHEKVSARTVQTEHSVCVDKDVMLHMTQEEFLSKVEACTLAEVERGLKSTDEKTIAMYKAIKALLEKRQMLPPIPREKRTR